jgi:hypothetical protein
VFTLIKRRRVVFMAWSVAVGAYSAVIDDVVASLMFGLTAVAASVGR